MTDIKTYVLALQIEGLNQFTDIFGSKVSRIVWEDISIEYADIGRELLQRYHILSEVVCPFPGRCFIPFRIIQSSILLNMEEQIGILTETCSQRIRTLLEKNLGYSTGSRLDFRVMISNLQENLADIQAVNKELDFLFKSCHITTRPHASISREDFKKIIDEKKVDIFFQSIVSLPEMKVAGYEALARGPGNTPFFNADILFGTALHLDFTAELELLCLEKALEWIRQIPEEYFVTINIGPGTLAQMPFWEIIARKEFQHFLPRLVMELTEHIPLQKISDLQEHIVKLKSLGIRLSLDDTGCGFFDLNTVEKLRPQIVKLCITVISRIGRSPEIASEISNTVAKIEEYGSSTLGEGVERKNQLDVLIQCNVKYAQGNYFDIPTAALKLFPP